MRYGGGGVGSPRFPGTTGVGGSANPNPWNSVLGRNWSHDYAERIVMSPDETHVWLLTRSSSFREFGALASGTGLVPYQTVTPSDEYRTLYYDMVNQSWQLRGLDGSVEFFLGKTAGSPAGALAGFLDKVTDRLYDPSNPTAHEAVQAAYNASNQLDHVTFPDGRRENFAYAGGASGKLASITEVGTDGTSTRTWTFLWSGDDLIAIGRPDLCSGNGVGSSWSFTYDPTHPGSLAQVSFKDCLNNGRIAAAFQYDSFGNVVQAWRGDVSISGPNAVDAIWLSFDSPALPKVTTLKTLIKRVVVAGQNQDTVQIGTYALDRDPGRGGAAPTIKVRIRSIAGECLSCGNTANPAFAYGDPSNPLLPTAVTDGNGNTTTFAYDARGRVLSLVEPVQASPAIQRQTNWTYSTVFSAFVSSVVGPFTPPGTPPAGVKTLALTFDGRGNLVTSTISGQEATYPTGSFSLQTAFRNYSAAGLPGQIDPPDTPSTTLDATNFTFQPGSNGYLVATAAGPVVGAPPIGAVTRLAYDAFNRPISVTDINGMVTRTTYDTLNRVTSVVQGYGTSQALTTTYSYNGWGDLTCVQKPAGNAIADAYDAAGRLISTARQASCAATQPIEQTLYTLDAVGHTIAEQRQRIVSGSPVTDATTTYAYTTTCHLDSTTAGDPSNPSAQSTTQLGYDCNGNLINTWDAKHNQPASPSPTYSYDSANRLIQMTQASGASSGASLVTSYQYDIQDHLLSFIDSERNQTSYVTSDRGLMTSQTSPVTGTTVYAYNDHGQLKQQTDARSVSTTRTLDPADRLTSVGYSADPSLATTYTYDTTSMAGTSPIGRLASISKGSGANETVVTYTYDLFGRMLQDGTLAYSYDANGNRAAIAYPGNVTACYGFDVADRQASLAYSTASATSACQGTTAPVVTSTAGAPTVYGAAGPLEVLHFASGTTEIHGFDQRFFPTAITAGSLLSWAYATDAMGNITSINQSVPTVQARTFVYQDYQYFLTQANGPWGTRIWSYDSIGDRLSENRGTGVTDTYTYLANHASPPGNTPIVQSIALAGNAGTKLLSYDPAGNVQQEAAPTSQLDFATDASGKLHLLTEETNRTSSTMLYDGRGFLSSSRNQVTDCGPVVTTATYSSDGLLYHRQRQTLFGGAIQAQARVFYFAGRPVAQLDGPPPTGALTYLTVDHLGTPILASGGITWNGGLEPFGRDYTSPSAQSSGIFLRLPGQWDDTSWGNPSQNSDLYYNLNRWYKYAVGRYIQPDPLGLEAHVNLFLYANAAPSVLVDPKGLAIMVCSRGVKDHPGLNHSYLWDTNRKTWCEAFSPKGTVERGPAEDACYLVPNSDGKEDAVFRCCEYYKNAFGTALYLPGLNDCQTNSHQSLACAGLVDPGVPGGRFHCRKCGPPH
ncbi:MAG: hypothetical protein M3O15_03070 [Acidobacteriota bacterium]|nr:hypothetical protein [Acidobacteriota bacterium]